MAEVNGKKLIFFCGGNGMVYAFETLPKNFSLPTNTSPAFLKKVWQFDFDPAAVRDTNSFEKPKSYPAGIPYTIVNGVVVIDGGTHTGARPGRPLFGRGFASR